MMVSMVFCVFLRRTCTFWAKIRPEISFFGDISESNQDIDFGPFSFDSWDKITLPYICHKPILAKVEFFVFLAQFWTRPPGTGMGFSAGGQLFLLYLINIESKNDGFDIVLWMFVAGAHISGQNSLKNHVLWRYLGKYSRYRSRTIFIRFLWQNYIALHMSQAYFRKSWIFRIFGAILNASAGH